jgi:hypothetical protein
LFTLIPTLLETVGDVTSSLSTGLTSGLTGIYEALSSTSRSTIKVSDAGVSGTIYAGSGNTTDLLNSSLSSVSDLVGNDIAGDEKEDV